jgi:hypothetical protein
MRLPSSGPLGHIRATNDRTAADNPVIAGPSSAQLTSQAEAEVAGRRDPFRLSDTEEVATVAG